jgi:DNA-directed RNA polymerase alpha subunit
MITLGSRHLSEVDIDELEAPTRVRNILFANSIRSLAALAEITESEFRRLPGVGPLSLEDLKAACAAFGFWWPRPQGLDDDD